MRFWPWRKQKDNLADIGAKTAGVPLTSATGIIAMHSPLEDAKRRCAESHRRMIQKRINADIREFTENYFKDKVIMDGLEDQRLRKSHADPSIDPFMEIRMKMLKLAQEWYQNQPTKEDKMEYEIVKQVTMGDVAAMGDINCEEFRNEFEEFECDVFHAWRKKGDVLWEVAVYLDPIPEAILRAALDSNDAWYEFMKEHGVVEEPKRRRFRSQQWFRWERKGHKGEVVYGLIMNSGNFVTTDGDIEHAIVERSGDGWFSVDNEAWIPIDKSEVRL